MKRSTGLAASVLLMGAGSANAQALPDSATQPVFSAAACAQLSDLRIGRAAIGLATNGGVITSAKMIVKDERSASANTSGAAGRPPLPIAADVTATHCLVSGNILPIDPKAPNIRFAVALPVSWNTKTVMLGGGGFSGTVPKVAATLLNAGVGSMSPLARGYAVFGSDSGHEATPTEGGAFLMNDEALANYMGDALKKTRDAAVVVIKAAYGKAPSRAYFIGGSTGGREALMVAGRFPKDWDGVVALYPARGLSTEVLGGVALNRALARPGAWLNPAKRGVLFAAALAACDSYDGAKDGLISDVRRCDATFKPATASINGSPLRCPQGKDTGDTCLSDIQLVTIETWRTPVRFGFKPAGGDTEFPGFYILSSDTGIPSASPIGPLVSWLALGQAPPAFPLPPGAPFSAEYSDNYMRYAVARDPAFNPLAFDPAAPGKYAGRLSMLSKLDAQDKDLDAFAARGGKAIILHGTADLIISARLTEAYYRGLQTRMGKAAIERFVRFYEVPGFGHAFSTNFYAEWDYLSAIEKWVEHDIDPSSKQIMTDTVGVAGRTRPLCVYPLWARYRGSGDINSAASFTCAGAR